MKLFEIHDAIEVVLAKGVDHETGEISEEALVELDGLEMARDEKSLAVARYLMGERAEAAAVKAQADRLAKRARIHANRADRLLGYLDAILPEGQKIHDDVVQIGWRSSTAVEVSALGKVPQAFVRVTEAPDKKAIGEALKSGVEVPGAELVSRNRLQVK